MVIIDSETVTLATATGPMLTHVFRPQAEGRYPAFSCTARFFS